MEKKDKRTLTCTPFVIMKNGEIWKCKELPEWDEVWDSINERGMRSIGYVPKDEFKPAAD